MIRPPPISPLFPYTTLFRSLLGGNPAGLADDFLREKGLDRTTAVPEQIEAAVREAEAICARDKEKVVGLGGLQDRKSTRLNSSHLVISYAVFCLKKKQNHSQAHHLTAFAVKNSGRSSITLSCLYLPQRAQDSVRGLPRQLPVCAEFVVKVVPPFF